ncbi:raffinose/stachyose/melibiose transport system substrate-binding protein [Ruminiclostridium sufflavum DSM 19573]|uniref:Raffinose/stachyose/melibiose transport system substrate-binding protein n=1 Tax=Ruminiclostridium sufflavum DSM 19573 TaxID=1121337 RepID=A0A318XPR9_9FIRM|nr:extracellular solute-binding protein [Ruminiclostridium sufflavum]PYG87755.1 raffinose/stachyose/melibiose transport system substrate-binding protein [Ruminiclostridium sufflavum DSM 19573]
MNKVLKKSLAAALAAALTVSIAGCGSEKTTEPSQSTASGNSAQTSAGDKVTLNMWHIQTTDPMPAIIEDSMKRFSEDNQNYKVVVTPMQNDAFKTKLQIAMSSNSTPDIFPHWTGGPMNQYVDSDKLADLTSYMNENDYKSRFMDAALSQVTYKDKLWAVPVENTSVAMMFYNKELFAKYNLQVPKTISELEKICDTLKSNGIIPFSLANKTQWTGSMWYCYLVDRYGGASAFTNAANRTGSFENEAFTQAGTKLQEWVKKDYFNKGFNGTDEDSGQSRTLLYSGKAAMTLMGSWFLSTVGGENKEFLEKVGSFSFPAVEGGKGDPNACLGTVGDNFYSVAKNSKDAAAAFKAITYLIDDTAAKKRIEAGRIPPIKGVTVSDSRLQEVLTAVEKAPTVQLWYDQYLSPELAQLHKDTSQALFGLEKTPEQVNKEMEALAAKQK